MNHNTVMYDAADIVADTDEPLQDAEESTEKAAWWMDDPKLMAIGASVLGVFLLILCIISYCCCCRRTKRTPGSNATHADEAKSSQLGNSTIMDSEVKPPPLHCHLFHSARANVPHQLKHR